MEERESRSEEPTEHRLAEARRGGVIPVSRDLQSALTALGICAALFLGGRVGLASLLAYLRTSLAQACSRGDLAGAGRASLHLLIDVLKVPLGVGMVAALVGGVVQTRGHFSFHAVRFDLGRVLPSMRRWRATDLWAELGKTLGKATIVMALAWWTMRPSLAGLIHLEGVPAGKTLGVLSTLAQTLGWRLACAAVTLGVVDYVWQEYRWRRSLRMTQDEVKREHKEREGDPRVKKERERLRFEFLNQQAIEEVRQASLVVTDGDISAVALRYDPKDSRAPVIVCKGGRVMATKMLQIARDFDVPICRDQALAAILAKADEDSEIPEVSHEAVARLLAARP